MIEDHDGKIDLQGFQEMLRKRRAPAPARRSQGNNKNSGSAGDPPEWLVTSQLRKSYFRPEENIPTRIRVIPQANGELFYEYMSAWVKRDGRNSMVISNAWNGERPLPCLLYDKYEEAYNDGGRDAADNFKAGRQFALTVVVLEEFYEVEKQGKKAPYFIYKQAPSPNRFGHVTENPEFEDCPRTFGRVLHWSMYTKQKEALEKNILSAMGTCTNCKEGRVEAVRFCCGNCDNVFADLREDQIPEDELKFLRSGKGVVCDQCDHEAPPEVIRECVVQKGYGSSARFEKGCDSPMVVAAGEPVDLVIRKVPAGNSWAVEILDVDVPSDIPELSSHQSNPQISTSAPLDFNRFFGRMKLRDQAFALGIDNKYDENVETIIDEYFAAPPEEEDADSIPF